MLYIDTNVVIDAIKGRKNKFGEDMGEAAMNVFAEAMRCKYYLVFSDWMYMELRRNINPGDADMLFALVKKKIVEITYTDADRAHAKILSPQNTTDALHVVLAEKTNADIIVTSDIGHFKKIKTHIPIKKPKWL